MTTKTTSSARKRYCVWADHVMRVHQHIEAESPRQALEAAAAHPDAWQPCDYHDHNGYQLSDELQDLETEEFVSVNASENRETDAERPPKLTMCLKTIRDMTESLDYEDGDPLGELAAKTAVLDGIRELAYSALKTAHGEHRE